MLLPCLDSKTFPKVLLKVDLASEAEGLCCFKKSLESPFVKLIVEGQLRDLDHPRR